MTGLLSEIGVFRAPGTKVKRQVAALPVQAVAVGLREDTYGSYAHGFQGARNAHRDAAGQLVGELPRGLAQPNFR